MTMTKALVLAASHALVAAVGFAGGIYALPILIAPPAPSVAEVGAVASKAAFSGQFRRDLSSAPYESIVGDPRTMLEQVTCFGQLSVRHDPPGGLMLMGRLSYDDFWYDVHPLVRDVVRSP